jgi:uncharacterized tellurite resistance protein B-like protein
MLDIIKRFFDKVTPEAHTAADADTGHDVQVATCALFLEMARIDESFTEQETEAILSILKEKYGLSESHADALITSADAELKNSIDYWQFAKKINENYTTEEKIEIIENLWRIVYVDGKMDKYEHHLMSKLSTLLRLSHNQLIDAKLKALGAD